MFGQSPGSPDSSPFCPELDAVAEEPSCHDISTGTPEGFDGEQSSHKSGKVERSGLWGEGASANWIGAAGVWCHDTAKPEKPPSTADESTVSLSNQIVKKVPSEDVYRPTAFEIGAPCTPPTSFLHPPSSTPDDFSSFDTSLPFFSTDCSLVVSPHTSFVHGHGPGLPGPAPCPDACPVCLTPGCVAEESGERSSFVYHVGPKRERSFRVKKTLLLDEQTAAHPSSPEGKNDLFNSFAGSHHGQLRGKTWIWCESSGEKHEVSFSSGE